VICHGMVAAAGALEMTGGQRVELERLDRRTLGRSVAFRRKHHSTVDCEPSAARVGPETLLVR
jgi:hypothetical protein